MVSSSRNLRGLRAYCGDVPATKVGICKWNLTEGSLAVTFTDGAVCVCEWASYEVLRQSLRTWRTLQGAPLEIDGKPAGEVGFRNPWLGGEPDKREWRWAQFERFTITLTADLARSCSHQGQCDDDVKAAVANPWVRRQLDALTPAAIAEELRGYGAWDDEELQDGQANYKRLVWLAAGNIVEEERGAK